MWFLFCEQCWNILYKYRNLLMFSVSVHIPLFTIRIQQLAISIEYQPFFWDFYTHVSTWSGGFVNTFPSASQAEASSDEHGTGDFIVIYLSGVTEVLENSWWNPVIILLWYLAIAIKGLFYIRRRGGCLFSLSEKCCNFKKKSSLKIYMYW